jgi:hypothetical protein
MDLDDNVVETTRANHAAAWIVDEFEGHTLVSGKLEHREATELRLRYVPEHRIPETRVDASDRSRSATRRPICNVLMENPVVRFSVGQSQAHVPTAGRHSAEALAAPVTGECRMSLRKRR